MRTGKIEASGPISSKKFLEKNKKTIEIHPRCDVDVVTLKDAKKACQKAENEGQVRATLLIKEIIYRSSQSIQEGGDYVIIAKDVADYFIRKINKLQSEILATKI